MDDRLAKAFDFSQDAAKQLITLSTAIVALTITFYKDFATGAGQLSKVLVAIGWGFFLLSIVFGVMHLFQLTGALAPKDDAPLKLHHLAADISLGAQQVFFVVGLFFTVLAAVLAL